MYTFFGPPPLSLGFSSRMVIAFFFLNIQLELILAVVLFSPHNNLVHLGKKSGTLP
jgi:hypothetical protein